MELKGLINVTEQHLILRRGAYTARKVAGLIVSRRLRLVDHILIKNTHRIESDFWKPSISANYSAFGVNSLTATHLLFHRVPDVLGSSYWFTHSFTWCHTTLSWVEHIFVLTPRPSADVDAGGLDCRVQPSQECSALVFVFTEEHLW